MFVDQASGLHKHIELVRPCLAFQDEAHTVLHRSGRIYTSCGAHIALFGLSSLSPIENNCYH